MKKLLLFLLVVSFKGHTACQDMVRAYWRYTPEKKLVELVHFAPQAIRYCEPLAQDSMANVLMKIQAGAQSFERPLFIPFFEYWDHLEGDELKGGVSPVPEIYFDSPIPVWAKKSRLILIDLSTGQELAQGAMK
jgi:hypothetical protein